jgi:hypothetical protein
MPPNPKPIATERLGVMWSVGSIVPANRRPSSPPLSVASAYWNADVIGAQVHGVEPTAGRAAKADELAVAASELEAKAGTRPRRAIRLGGKRELGLRIVVVGLRAREAGREEEGEHHALHGHGHQSGAARSHSGAEQSTRSSSSHPRST